MLIAGNWKMHTDLPGARRLARNVADALDKRGDAMEGIEVAVCPPFTGLQAAREAIGDRAVALGAQDMHAANKGAYTGEVSAPMLTSVGCQYVILGHSERRSYYGETDATVNEKVHQARQHDLVPIICVGETKAQRDAGNAETVVRTQLTGALDGLTVSSGDQIVIAYEPVWAIGTGDSATPDQAQSMHAFIQDVLVEAYGDTVGRAVRLLYGGSMKPHNARSLLGQPQIDGGLIGSASLSADDFVAIAEEGQAAREA